MASAFMDKTRPVREGEQLDVARLEPYLRQQLGAEGPLEVEVFMHPSEIEVVVRDHGTGIRPDIGATADGSSGIGMLVIQVNAVIRDARKQS